MKKILLQFIAAFFFLNAFSQTETFDIATFTPPTGWQRIDSMGIVAFLNSKTTNGLTSFCQLFLYPSRATNSSPSKNFEMEWNNLVVKPTGAKGKPQTETEKTPDGWTAVTGHTNITLKGTTYTCMLVSASGFGKVISVLVNIAGQDYVSDVQNFLDKLELNAKAMNNNNSNDKQIITGPASLSNYIYTAPQGWITTTYPDGIVFSSPASNTGEKCKITLWPMHQASSNLQNDATNLFNEVFKSFVPKQSSTSPSMIKGTSVQGWSYFIIKQAI